jgi:DNA polymerase I-like protein with 3'-5' exonuclease and polymerase domains
MVNERGQPGRGTMATARLLPAAFLDLDVGADGHTATDHPATAEEALQALADAVPLAPSFVVSTGGGVHPYWLLEAPLDLSEPGAREVAKATLLRLEATVREAWRRQGWHLDSVADLARVLRPAGSVNRKKTRTAPAPVTMTAPTGVTYELADLAGVCLDPDYVRTEGPKAGVTARAVDDAAFLPADLAAIEAGCAFMAQAKAHPERQTEPFWLRQLSIAGRCAGGGELAHDRSRGHPGYSPGETERKLARALAHGPATCAYIEERLGFAGCASCVFRGKLTSPIQLGRTEAQNRPGPDREPPPATAPEPGLSFAPDAPVDAAPPDDGAPHPAEQAAQQAPRDGRPRAGDTPGGSGSDEDDRPPWPAPRRHDREAEKAARTARLAEAVAVVRPLPDGARLPDAERRRAAAAVAVWLGPYAAASAQLVPRAPARFHRAAGLAVLCTAIARRARLTLTGTKHLYPSLMPVLCARSTVYAKTETLNVARDALHAAGLDDLLLPAAWTPPAVVAELALQVPQAVRDAGKTEQGRWLARRRHAGQRGVIRDELATLFAEAAGEHGNGLLDVVLKADGAPEVLDGSLTLTRGTTVARNVSLTILGGTTPAALRTPARSPALWQSGVFGRLILLGPGRGPIWAPWPEGAPGLPAAVVDGLKKIHQALGVPRVEFETETVTKRSRSGDDPEEVERIVGATQLGYEPVAVAFSPEARCRSDAYARALFDLYTAPGFPDRLTPTYGRLPELAGRVAVALAVSERILTRDTVDGAVIGSGHWGAAQLLAEDWRAAVHEALADVVRDAETEEAEDARGAVDDDRARRLVAAAREARERALLAGEPDPGLTRDDCLGALSRHVPAAELDELLDRLVERDVFVRERVAAGPRGGRPSVVHRLSPTPGGAPPAAPTVDVRENEETPPDLGQNGTAEVLSREETPTGAEVSRSAEVSSFSRPQNGVVPAQLALDGVVGVVGAETVPPPGTPDGPEAPPDRPLVGDLGFPLDASGALQSEAPVAVAAVVSSDRPGALGWYFTTDDPTTRTAFPVACWMPLAEAEARGLWAPAVPDGAVLVTDAGALAAELPALLEAPAVGLDVETTGLDPHRDRLRLVQLAIPGRVVLVDASACPVAGLAPLFEAPAGPRLLGHHLAFDLRFLTRAGLPPPPGERLFDTMLAAQVLDAGEHLHQAGRFTLEAVGDRQLGVALDKGLQTSDWGAPGLTTAQLAYAADDARVLLPLAEALTRALADSPDGDLRPVAGLESGALPAVAWTELTGAPFDAPSWEALARRAEEALPALREAVIAFARSLSPDGGEGWLDAVTPYTDAQVAPTKTGKARKLPERAFNPDSRDQQLRLLRALGVTVADAQEATLAAVRGQHPVVETLLALKAVTKQATAFGTDYLQHVHPATGRIHAGYAQVGGEAGRMSCIAAGSFVDAPRDLVRCPKGLPIEAIEPGQVVYAFDDTNTPRPRRVLAKTYMGRRRVLKLVWRGRGRHAYLGELKATPEHRVRLEDGQYRRLDALRPGDRLAYLTRSVHADQDAVLRWPGAGPIDEHQLLAPAPAGWLTHHRDGNHLNNTPENLEVVRRAAHTSGHAQHRQVSRKACPYSGEAFEALVAAGIVEAIRRGRHDHASLRRWAAELGVEIPDGRRWLCPYSREELAALLAQAPLHRVAAERGHTWRLFRRWVVDAGLSPVRENHAVVAVVDEGETLPVYDLTIEGDPNFVVNEIAVHNCRGPNLQQVPHDAEYRACFRAPAGRVLVRADYAQIELCVIAELAGDRTMLDALVAGDDLHRLTAAALYGKAPEAVTPAERAFGKNMNFGTVFGQGVAGLKRQAAAQGIPLSDAQARVFLARFDRAWPQLARWRRQQLRSRAGVVRTVGGRQRRLAPTDPGTYRLNTPVQGTAADGFKAALGELWATRGRCPSGAPALLVHDELVVEADERDAAAAVAWVTGAMVAGMRRYLHEAPVRVEAAVSRSWGGPPLPLPTPAAPEVARPDAGGGDAHEPAAPR